MTRTDVPLLQGVPKDEAEGAAEKFKAVGCEVELR